MKDRVLIGPMVVAAWVVAAGWLVIGGAAVASGTSPLTLTVAAAAVVLCVGTAWLGLRMIVRLTSSGVRVGSRTVAWDDLEGVGVRRDAGPLNLPFLSVRQGRALVEVDLDGLASVGGPQAAVRAVAPIAQRAGVEPHVGTPAARRQRGRRVLP